MNYGYSITLDNKLFSTVGLFNVPIYERKNDGTTPQNTVSNTVGLQAVSVQQ